MKNFALKIFVTTVVLFYSVMVIGNNIQVSNLTLTGKNTTDHFMLVQFDISWENSWHSSTAPGNWDAAWVFMKYRIPGGEWQHAWLNNAGHTAPSGSTIMAGLMSPGTAFNATTNPVMGTFIYRSSDESANTFSLTGVKLRWNYGANGVSDAANIEIKIFCIEMVYVPQGSFSVGDGTTTSVTGQFTAHNTTGNFTIIGESVPSTLGGTTLGNLGNNNNSNMTTPDDFDNATTKILPAAFPKGYNPFFCMKYEISQQQYVDFLNNLTQTQLYARKYDKPVPNWRYNIIGSVVDSITTSTPYVACNFLSWDDVAAYLDWSGLRPMTEMEFEKACRGTIAAVANEYAWGSTSVTQITGIANSGLIDEKSTNGGNCSYGGIAGVLGPMRVGSVADVSTNRVQSGSTYYGIMDMGGNLWERTIMVGSTFGRSYTGNHGDGILTNSGLADVSNWPSSNGAGFRGGGWEQNVENARISSRSIASNNVSTRLRSFGGRGVRSQPLPVVTTTAISSITHNSATSGGNVTSDAGSAITARGVCWSTTTGPTIALTTKTSETGTTGVFTSNLTALDPNTTYYVRAYATNSMGTSYGNEVSFTTLQPPFICSVSSLTIIHVTSDGVAPVAKTVTYATVDSIPGEINKCWITSNLGSDHQATSVTDATEASAGWYWQFNRKQGYKHTGASRTPNTSWITQITDPTWQIGNDPCRLELGGTWRLPTYYEWLNVDGASGGNWTNWNGPFNSGLKLHAAGSLASSNGALSERGVAGRYWSSGDYAYTMAYSLDFWNIASGMYGNQKVIGMSVRCIND